MKFLCRIFAHLWVPSRADRGTVVEQRCTRCNARRHRYTRRSPWSQP